MKREQKLILIAIPIILVIIILLLISYHYFTDREIDIYAVGSTTTSGPYISIIGSNASLITPIKAIDTAFNKKYNISVNIANIDSNNRTITAISKNMADVGIITRNLTSQEKASGLRQVIIAYNNTTNIPLILIINNSLKSSDEMNYTNMFINFTQTNDGQVILAKQNLVPIKNSNETLD